MPVHAREQLAEAAARLGAAVQLLYLGAEAAGGKPRSLFFEKESFLKFRRVLRNAYLFLKSVASAAPSLLRVELVNLRRARAAGETLLEECRYSTGN